MTKWLACASLGVLAALAGCQAPKPPEVIIRREPRLMDRPLPMETIVGRSVNNRPIEAVIVGSGDDTVLAIATIHGNESAGTPILQRLAEYLKNRPELLTGRKVVIVPVANPDGMAAGTRANARSVDLNRNFAAVNRLNNARNGDYALSEPEALAIERLIRRFEPDRILTIHQPLSCIDYDGPGRAIADVMAEHCSLPVKKLGARPGSLGAFAGETLNIPTITLELRPGDEGYSVDRLWTKYGDAVIAAVVFPDGISNSELAR